MIIGITQEPSTREYYLVFYYEIRPILDKIIEFHKEDLQYVQYSDFDKVKEIGSGGHGTVYTAKYKKYLVDERIYEDVVLKSFKNFDQIQTQELFISEASIFYILQVSLDIVTLLYNDILLYRQKSWNKNLYCIAVVIKSNSRYKDILDIATIWVGTERVVISRPTCINSKKNFFLPALRNYQ